MEQNELQALREGLEEGLVQLVYSNAAKAEEFSKVKVRLIQLKGTVCYQATEYRGQKVFHSNYTKEQLEEKLKPLQHPLLMLNSLVLESQTLANDTTPLNVCLPWLMVLKRTFPFIDRKML